MPALAHLTSDFLRAGRVAAITGAASGIGRAAAIILASRGLRLALCDIDLGPLEALKKEIETISSSSSNTTSSGNATDPEAGEEKILIRQVDVRKEADVMAWKQEIVDTYGEVNILMNNAAIGEGGGTYAGNLDKWRNLLDVNLFGVINGVQTFAPFMEKQENSSVIINTGSKQGITCPPGNAAYNVSKAAVKTLTEQLAHELRTAESTCSAHLFIPGWTWSAMTGNDGIKEKPSGAWTAEQTVEYMLTKVDKGAFYVVCPDNEASEELDKLRMAWSGTDPAAGRPALSRWHPGYKAKFDEYMSSGSPAEAMDY